MMLMRIWNNRIGFSKSFFLYTACITGNFVIGDIEPLSIPYKGGAYPSRLALRSVAFLERFFVFFHCCLILWQFRANGRCFFVCFRSLGTFIAMHFCLMITVEQCCRRSVRIQTIVVSVGT